MYINYTIPTTILKIIIYYQQILWTVDHQFFFFLMLPIFFRVETKSSADTFFFISMTNSSSLINNIYVYNLYYTYYDSKNYNILPTNPLDKWSSVVFFFWCCKSSSGLKRSLVPTHFSSSQWQILRRWVVHDPAKCSVSIKLQLICSIHLI
jgi:hypothetical protein